MNNVSNNNQPIKSQQKDGNSTRSIRKLRKIDIDLLLRLRTTENEHRAISFHEPMLRNEISVMSTQHAAWAFSSVQLNKSKERSRSNRLNTTRNRYQKTNLKGTVGWHILETS